MTLNEYQAAQNRTGAGFTLIVFTLGLAGEAGEVIELVKKHIGHGHSLDRQKMLIELGDVLWYVSALAGALGFTLEEVAQANIDKLKRRYPDGFSSERSQNRSEEE